MKGGGWRPHHSDREGKSEGAALSIVVGALLLNLCVCCVSLSYVHEVTVGRCVHFFNLPATAPQPQVCAEALKGPRSLGAGLFRGSSGAGGNEEFIITWYLGHLSCLLE